MLYVSFREGKLVVNFHNIHLIMGCELPRHFLWEKVKVKYGLSDPKHGFISSMTSKLASCGDLHTQYKTPPEN